MKKKVEQDGLCLRVLACLLDEGVCAIISVAWNVDPRVITSRDGECRHGRS